MSSYVERLKRLDVASVSDAMDKLGVPCGLHGIKPILNEGEVMCGTAFTVHYVPCGQVKGTVGDFLDDVKPGQVVVIDNAGRDYCTVWGDIMSYTAKKRGVEGTLIDGVCCDLPMIKKVKYPIFSKGYYMVTGKDRVEVDEVNIPVAVSGIRVCPEDFILGDSSGCIVVPQDIIEKVLEVAEGIEVKEKQILAEIDKGVALKEARKLTGYHKLQTKGTE